MAKQRIVNTKFWDDSYIVRLSPTTKLVFLYLLTNPLTNISGVYELPLRRAAFDVGIPEAEIQKIVSRFIADKKVIYCDGWVAIVNFLKYQTIHNPKVRQGIALELKKVPPSLLARLPLDADLLRETNMGERPLEKNEAKNTPRSNGLRSIRELLPTMDSLKTQLE